MGSSRTRAAGAGRLAGGLERVRRASAGTPLAGAGARRAVDGAGAVHPRAAGPAPARTPPRGAAGPRGGRGSGGGRRRDDGRATGPPTEWPRATCPIPPPGCWCASRSARCGARRRPFARPSAACADGAFGPRWGRLVQSAAFGLSHVAGAARPVTSDPDARGCGTTRARHRCHGRRRVGVRLALRTVGQPGGADAGTPGDQRSGRRRCAGGAAQGAQGVRPASIVENDLADGALGFHQLMGAPPPPRWGRRCPTTTRTAPVANISRRRGSLRR